MKFYPTPSFIVDIIRKHIPKTAYTVLEPAVGEGALLSALEESDYKYTLIDIDRARLDALSSKLKKHKLIHGDFICWSKENELEKFDLILTNPPFSAKAESWIDFEGEYIPIEIAFITQARKLLKVDGTLIAIVPDSIINSSRFLKYRKHLIEICSIKYVYQLPQKLFSKTEGGFYLIVLRARGSTKQISLRDATSSKGKEIVVSEYDLRENMYRFDYRYYRGNKKISQIIDNINLQVPSACLNTFCKIARGSIRSNYHEKYLHHTNSFVNGFWRGFTFKNLRQVEESCIAVKRVSRDAHQSFGLIDKDKNTDVTDCLILIEQSVISPLKLLFFMRVVYSNEYGKECLLKGSGAKFIAVELIRSLYFFDISTIFPNEFNVFSKAYLDRDLSKCLQVENYVFNCLASRMNIVNLNARLEEASCIPLKLVALST